jgi:hypothetical protein
LSMPTAAASKCPASPARARHSSSACQPNQCSHPRAGRDTPPGSAPCMQPGHRSHTNQCRETPTVFVCIHAIVYPPGLREPGRSAPLF